jgi:hypothetical protein
LVSVEKLGQSRYLNLGWKSTVTSPEAEELKKEVQDTKLVKFFDDRHFIEGFFRSKWERLPGSLENGLNQFLESDNYIKALI